MNKTKLIWQSLSFVAVLCITIVIILSGMSTEKNKVDVKNDEVKNVSYTVPPTQSDPPK